MATAQFELYQQLKNNTAVVPKSSWIGLIAAQVFCAFLTETKFIPTLKNNVGAFEVTAVFFVAIVGAYFLKNGLPVRTHQVFTILGLLIPVAALSILQIPSERIFNGLIAVIILIFLVGISLAMYNLVMLNEKYLFYLMRALALSSLVVGAWVLIDSITSGGDISANGPYRNRAQMGAISLTSFWVVMVYAFYPGVKRLERIIVLAASPLLIYAVAVSGRRSVYLALVIGMVLFAASTITARGVARLKVFMMVGFALAVFWVIYTFLAPIWFPARFFVERLGMVQGRFEMATGGTNGEDDGIEDPSERFNRAQREGVYKAFLSNPLLGIGWGGYYDSEYSETKHEVHSTPMRFVAETGLAGIILYICLMGRILWGAVWLWLITRRTIYHLSAHILGVALFSLSFSYVYNRQMTERTFWLLLVIFISFETIIWKKFNPSLNRPLRTQPT